ncbi:MAG: hypothetical protein MUP70_11765 [Candidatus Aminicenantes bacterium]|nr:hypothetical protein [Candidatus Aminicenantes bacterium]
MRGMRSAPPPEAIGDIPPESARPAMGRSRMQMSFPPLEAFEDPLLSYYRQFPAVYDLDKLRMESIMPKKMEDTAKYGDFYTLIDSWSSAWQASVPITESPEISDFRISGGGGRGRPIGDRVPFKSPALASELIKTVTHHFGASMVGITTINPDWCYNYGLRGSKERGPFEVPKH